MLRHSLQDRYRCPEGFFAFGIDGELSLESGFFQFGSDVTCYGRSSAAFRVRPAPPLSDALRSTTAASDSVRLAFDPDEVIENFRLERYPSSGWSPGERAMKRLYYWLRPLTSRSLRKSIQKLRAAGWQKSSFPQWPVDTSVENICESLLALSMRAQSVETVPFVWFWPRAASGCVVMTHDVEAQAGRDYCAELLNLDDAFGIKASYQIVPEDRYEVSADLLDRIRTRGHEICVQDLNHDGRLFDSYEEFKRRAAIINGYGRQYGARGFRSAVLYRKPEWLENLEFSFDMSFPNVSPLDPQRGGCCTVLPYFIGDLLEIPVTTVQDYTLFHLLEERSIDLWKIQVEKILAKNGLVSFIVHPDYIMEHDTRAVYEKLIAWLRELRATGSLWFALPHEIDDWWRARQKMRVAKHGDSWRVEGDGAERATLAFARLKNGRLVYEHSPANRTAQSVGTV